MKVNGAVILRNISFCGAHRKSERKHKSLNILTSFRSADLSKFWRSFRLRRSEERVGVLQPAAEGHLTDIVVCSVSAHFPLSVGQNLGHDC